MKKYLFAHLFIRLAILLSILVVLLGIGQAVLNVNSMLSRLNSLKFSVNPSLLTLVAKTQENYEKTRDRLAQTLEDPVLPSTLPPVDFTAALNNLKRQTPQGQLQTILSLAEQTESSVAALKEYHSASMQRAIANLRKTLLERAAEIKRQLQAQNPQPTPDQTQPDAQETPKNQEQTTARYRIFDDRIENDRDRLQFIIRTKNYFEELKRQSQREESLDQIRRIQIFLTRAEALLDTALLNEREQTQTQNQIPRPEQPPTITTDAEKVAAYLLAIQNQTQASLYSSWIVDALVSELKNLAQEELQRAEKLKSESNAVRDQMLSKTSTDISITLGVAFLILVFADLLKAFVNQSANTDKMLEILDRLYSTSAEATYQNVPYETTYSDSAPPPPPPAPPPVS